MALLSQKCGKIDPGNQNHLSPAQKRIYISASKSKYCPVSANVALRDVMEIDGRYAVVGLPCHIQGVRKASMVFKDLRRRIVLCIGLLCSHNDTFRATQNLIDKYAKGYKITELKQVTYRGPGWPGFLTLMFVDNTKISVPYNKYIFNHFIWFILKNAANYAVMLLPASQISQ